MSTDDSVFISYAREDRSWAERLYMDLRKQEINAWLDVRCLAAGANWKFEIKRAIRRCGYFLLLVSRHSINKRGFVQQEMKEAIDVLQEFPKGSVFLIPVRLDTTEPIDDELRALNWVDLHPNYQEGLARILSSVTPLRPTPLIIVGGEDAPTSPAIFIDKGREITVNVPMILGPRASISYAPFRTAREFVQQFFDRLPSEHIYADKTLSYYVTFDTRPPNVLLGDDLKQKYPEYITLVLQNSFRELQAREEGFSVILRFDGVERTIGVPYDAVRMISVPEIGLSISIELPANTHDLRQNPTLSGTESRV